MDITVKTGHIADDSLYVTVGQLARVFGCTTRTIRRLMETGQLPGQKLGTMWRMHKDDFAVVTRPQLARLKEAA